MRLARTEETIRSLIELPFPVKRRVSALKSSEWIKRALIWHPPRRPWSEDSSAFLVDRFYGYTTWLRGLLRNCSLRQPWMSEIFLEESLSCGNRMKLFCFCQIFLTLLSDCNMNLWRLNLSPSKPSPRQSTAWSAFSVITTSQHIIHRLRADIIAFWVHCFTSI